MKTNLTLFLLIMFVSGNVAAQSTPPRKDIPTIAKAAEGTIVSIVMSDKDGKPIGQGSGFFISKNGYYEEVIGSVGRANIDSFVRLYMVPGMQHCFAGPGADMFGQSPATPGTSDPQRNARTALENWVEKGTAPDVIIASKIEGAAPATVESVIMTRPQCPYPQQAHYKGSGDPNRAENFACATAKK